MIPQYCVAYNDDVIASGAADSTIILWSIVGRSTLFVLVIILCFVYKYKYCDFLIECV